MGYTKRNVSGHSSTDECAPPHEGATNPVEAFLLDKEAAAVRRKDEELVHLNKWQQTRDPVHLQPLLKAYEPVISSKVYQYKAPTIPESAFKAELTRHLIGAFDSFNPDRGAALNTHVNNRLMKAMRYNARYQNTAYIPEGQLAKITPVQRAHEELAEDFGRPPTHSEIADHLGMSVRQVTRVLSSQKRDVPASMFESDPTDKSLSRDDEVMALLPYTLTDPKEKEVFSYLYGENKHLKPASMGGLAKQLGMSNSALSRVHTSILDKFKQYK
jgi:DNA-directed RNA polymerase specialized sigma subunit